MSCFQATTYKPHGGLILDRPVVGLGRTCKILPLCSLYSHSSGSRKLQQQVYLRLILIAASHQKLGPLYVSSSKGNAEIVNDPFSMESLKKAMAGAKKQWSIQDFLKDQFAKISQGSDGNGGNRNRRGGSGGGFGGPEDESFKERLVEIVQVFLATIAFILVYIHIIRGEELYRLARDCTRYLVTGKRTARLKRAMHKWRNFSKSTIKKESPQEDWYGIPNASKTMWWQQPKKLAHLVEELWRGYLRPHAQES